VRKKDSERKQIMLIARRTGKMREKAENKERESR